MTRSEMDKLNVPIMRAFNKIFHVFDKNSVQLIVYVLLWSLISLSWTHLQKIQIPLQSTTYWQLESSYLSAIEHAMPEWIYKWFFKWY